MGLYTQKEVPDDMKPVWIIVADATQQIVLRSNDYDTVKSAVDCIRRCGGAAMVLSLIHI